MKLAVSNIAWRPTERDEAYRLLRRHGIRGLEIAPKLFLPQAQDAFAPTDEEVEIAMAAARDARLELVSMQSLLFGAEGVALFENAESRELLVEASKRAIRLAGRLSIPNLVFGSPRQRNIPPGLEAAEADAIAREVFRRLGDVAQAAGAKLGLEPNPAIYGTNFLNRFEDAEAFARDLGHPAIRVILDVGAMIINDDLDTLSRLTPERIARVSHVHLSEPQLAPAPADPTLASQVLKALTGAGYDGWVSIEMATPVGGLAELDAALSRLGAAVRLAQA